MYLINALKKYKRKRKPLFTTPGHWQGKIIPPSLKNLIGKDIFLCDMSEVEGLDNLQNPEGVILKSQQKAAKIYNSKNTFYLLNGTSSGVLSLFISNFKKGDKVLISRNSHQSVINALILTGVYPIWINNEWEEKWDMPKPVEANDIKTALDNNPEIKALFITNPTYYGLVGDIKPIAKICKEKKVLLLVDEAHGALWNFSKNLPTPAILEGADASVQSLHKTACSLTPAAVLHISKDSTICPNRVQQSLNIINTTSPSYPMLASIEGCINYLTTPSAKLKLEELIENISILKNDISGEFEFLESYDDVKTDITKLFLSLNGISGNSLDDFLQEKYGLEVELSNRKGILALCGIGTNKVKLDKLKYTLLKASKKLEKNSLEISFKTQLLLPQISMSPQEAFYSNTKKIELKHSEGFICAESIINYPPGVPVLTPGEVITSEHINILQDKKNIKIVDL